MSDAYLDQAKERFAAGEHEKATALALIAIAELLKRVAERDHHG